METIKIFLTELDPALAKPKSGSFWSMVKPTVKEVPDITKAIVEKEVRNVSETECAKIKLPDGVKASVFDKNDNKIFGGHMTQAGAITLFPLTEIFKI